MNMDCTTVPHWMLFTRPWLKNVDSCVVISRGFPTRDPLHSRPARFLLPILDHGIDDCGMLLPWRVTASNLHPRYIHARQPLTPSTE